MVCAEATIILVGKLVLQIIRWLEYRPIYFWFPLVIESERGEAIQLVSAAATRILREWGAGSNPWGSWGLALENLYRASGFPIIGSADRLLLASYEALTMLTRHI